MEDLIYSSKESELTSKDFEKLRILQEKGEDRKYGTAPCSYFKGMSNYFNAHNV
jgi:hypothetical protein